MTECLFYQYLLTIACSVLQCLLQLTPISYGPFRVVRRRSTSELFQVNVLRALTTNKDGKADHNVDNNGLGLGVSLVSGRAVVSHVTPSGPVGRNGNIRSVVCSTFDLYVVC